MVLGRGYDPLNLWIIWEILVKVFRSIPSAITEQPIVYRPAPLEIYENRPGPDILGGFRRFDFRGGWRGAARVAGRHGPGFARGCRRAVIVVHRPHSGGRAGRSGAGARG